MKYRCIKQHDEKDCGVACLATIAKQYGLKIPISKIREVAGTDKKGTSALGIIKAAESIGFTAKGIKASKPEDIFGEFPKPAIAHVIINKNLLHYVVIHKVTEKEIIVADPAKGIVKYTPKEFFEIWTGILLIMVPSPSFEKGDETKGLFQRFWGLIKVQKNLLVNVFILQPQLQSAMVAAERLGEILDLETEKAVNEDKKINLKTLLGNIELKNIDFRYGSRQIILKNISMNIKPGEKIALVGESGSGKTNIAKLLMDFYDVEKGEILINTYNIKDINKEALRDKISYIYQDSFFFSGTIRENLQFAYYH